MATTIKLKNSVTTTNAPSSLAQGEVAINITDKKVWVGNAATTPIQLLGDGGSVNFTTVDTTNLQVTNIKAKDGTASASIANSTGAFTVAAAFAANGGATLGDASGDALTINSSAVSIPNGLNFDSNTLVIDATNDRVGINTSSPSARLDVHRSGSSTGLSGVVANPQLAVTNAGNWGNSTGMLFRAPLTSGGAISNNAAVWAEWSADNNAYLAFATNGSGTLAERMRITSAGNVGIGTSSPTGQLHIETNNSTSDAQVLIRGTNNLNIGSTNDALKIRFEDTDTTSGAGGQPMGTIQWYGNDASSYPAGVRSYIQGYGAASSQAPFLYYSTGEHIFQTTADGGATNSERMRITSTGLVGIGTSSPNYLINTSRANTTLYAPLSEATRVPSATMAMFVNTNTADGSYSGISFQVARTAGTSSTAYLGAVSTTSNPHIVFGQRDASNELYTERMRITSAGEVLVGGTTNIGSLQGYISIERANDSPQLSFFRNDTSVSLGNGLGQVAFYGNDTTSNTPTRLAYIIASASGTHAAGDNPTDIAFGTTPDGTETVAEAGRITQSGAYVLKGGTTTAAAGVGIVFPATQVASADANCLDDYEEGTFTPTLTGGFSVAPTSYTNQLGRYTKIGRLVYFEIDLDPNGATAGVGAVTFGGLPFTSAAAPYGGAVLIYQSSFNTNSGDSYAVDTATTTISIYTDTGTTRKGNDAGVNINNRITFCGCYTV